VGTKTPGRLLSGSAYKVGHGYILGLPVAAYLTWQGRMLENNGIRAEVFCCALARSIEARKGHATRNGNRRGESSLIAEWLCSSHKSRLPSGHFDPPFAKLIRASYEKALALTQQEPERQFLQERIRQLK
jgi:hypothetical protein